MIIIIVVLVVVVAAAAAASKRRFGRWAGGRRFQEVFGLSKKVWW